MDSDQGCDWPIRSSSMTAGKSPATRLRITGSDASGEESEADTASAPPGPDLLPQLALACGVRGQGGQAGLKHQIRLPGQSPGHPGAARAEYQQFLGGHVGQLIPKR